MRLKVRDHYHDAARTFTSAASASRQVRHIRVTAMCRADLQVRRVRVAKFTDPSVSKAFIMIE
jgi:hypothetical protein